MPFKSRQQEKWAFATKQPFAKKWADITDQKTLPKRVTRKKKYSKKLLKRYGFTKSF